MAAAESFDLLPVMCRCWQEGVEEYDYEHVIEFFPDHRVEVTDGDSQRFHLIKSGTWKCIEAVSEDNTFLRVTGVLEIHFTHEQTESYRTGKVLDLKEEPIRVSFVLDRATEIEKQWTFVTNYRRVPGADKCAAYRMTLDPNPIYTDPMETRNVFYGGLQDTKLGALRFDGVCSVISNAVYGKEAKEGKKVDAMQLLESEFLSKSKPLQARSHDFQAQLQLYDLEREYETKLQALVGKLD